LRKSIVLFSMMAVLLFAFGMIGQAYALLGDLNHDGKVDIKDLAIISKQYGLTKDNPNFNPEADLYPDGKIDIRDIVIVVSNFGKTE